MKKLSFFALMLLCLFSCTDDGSTPEEGKPSPDDDSKYKVTVEASFWGEDIIYNESGKDLTMTLYHTYDKADSLSVDILAGHSDTLDLPSLEYTISITMSSDSLKIEFVDGKQIITKSSEDMFYGTYEKEETIIYRGDAEVDTPWPTYKYRITTEHYNLAD